jgi:hypothetical protein
MFEKFKNALNGDYNALITSIISSIGAIGTLDTQQLIYTLIFVCSSIISLWASLKKNKHSDVINQLDVERKRIENAILLKQVQSTDEK